MQSSVTLNIHKYAMGLNWVLTFMWEIFLKTKTFLRNYCIRLLKFKTSISIPENLNLVAYVGALSKLKKTSPITQISDVFFHLYLFLKDFDPIVNYRLPSLKSMRCAIVITSIAKKERTKGFVLWVIWLWNCSTLRAGRKSIFAQLSCNNITFQYGVVEFKEGNLIAQTSVHY